MPCAALVFIRRANKHLATLLVYLIYVFVSGSLSSLHLFDARTHKVSAVETRALNRDLSRGNTSDELRVMQFDQELQDLQTSGLCDAGTSSFIVTKSRSCSEFVLKPDSALEYCGSIGLTSASRRGQGSYYYPNKPVWISDDNAWDLKNSQRLYLTGPTILHSLDTSQKPTIIFPGYPEFKSTAVFYRLPCNKKLDETLLAVAICIFVSAVTHAILYFDELKKLAFIPVSKLTISV